MAILTNTDQPTITNYLHPTRGWKKGDGANVTKRLPVAFLWSDGAMTKSAERI